MKDKKITALRLINLKKIIRQNDGGFFHYKPLIHETNLSLNKSSILGILGGNQSETTAMLFKLLIDNKINPYRYQGYIEYKLEDQEEFSSIANDIEYRKNISYGFNDESLFKAKTKETVFSYLEKYIRGNEVIASLTNIFNNNWTNIYQDSRFHLGLNYFKINLNLQQDIRPLIQNLKNKLDEIYIKNIRSFKLDEKLQAIQEINTLIRKIIEKIQYNEKEFFIFLEKTIENYNSGKSLLQYKEYKQAKKVYLEVFSRKNQIKSRANTNSLFNRIKRAFQKAKIKFSKKIEIKKYYLKLQKNFEQEIKFTRYELSKHLRNEAFLHHFLRYYLAKIYYKFIKKYHSQIVSLDKTAFINFVQDMNNLKDSMIFEIQSSVDSNKSNANIKRRVKVLENSMFSKNSKIYLDRFKYFKEDEDKKITKEVLLKDINLNNTTDNLIDVSQLKQYEYDYLEKQAEYRWNIDTEGKKVKSEAKKYFHESSPIFWENKGNLKYIKQRILRLLKDIFYNDPSQFKELKELNSSLMKPFTKAVYDLDELNRLLFNLFNQYFEFKEFIENSNNKKADLFFELVLKSSIYKILTNSDISLDKLTMNLSYLTEEEKVRLEFQKMLINKPSLVILGPNINRLKKELQFDIINQLNSYILDNQGLAIYFLEDISIAKKFTSDIYIINDTRVIEQGKTKKVLDNPINPLLKLMLNEIKPNDSIYLDYIKNLKNLRNISCYEIDDDHFVWCKWDELFKWLTVDQIQNEQLKKLFKVESTVKVKNKESLDQSNFNDIGLIDYSDMAKNNRKDRTMDKTFNHIIVEEGRNQKWIDMKAFINHDLSKEPFTIILPPPNVTGKLHIGHALDTYIADTIIRYKKLKGYDVMWVPGKDHAGIATQAVVEKHLATQGMDKYKLGRDKFIKEIWKWKQVYSENINKQWAKLGLALDYSAERFTFDDEANEAVMKAFIDLYNEGLIYRDTKPISWDTKLKTALSNIEVIPTEVKQKMYYIKYPIKDSSQYLIVATTRPETMFSDVALALNPLDPRFSILKESLIVHPLTKREIPIVSDDKIDLKFGTGIMKVSAHATDDIDIIKKYNLLINECIDDEGKMNSLAGALEGVDRFEARELVVELLEKNGYISKTENIVSNVGYSERSKEPIEILVKKQWFVRMQGLSEDLLRHLSSTNGIKIRPKRFEDNLVKWMENIHDWTISRQIWWGHRIPAWYKDDQVLVQKNSPGEGWEQETDVLDTWFSSGLAPFMFLGWPQNSARIKRYYPTNLLVTAYDILFFWVSRMYFQGLHFMHEKPFEELLLHGIVRDSKGKKMSKSLGNGIDPIEVIGEYGSDVLKMALVFNTSPGQDLNFGQEKIKASRLFLNKFWNIARLISPLPVNLAEKIDFSLLDEYDKWILDEFNFMTTNIDLAMKNYEFSIVYKHIYDFIINKFSSWYLEFLKFKKNDYFIHYLFRDILIVLHPYMPFLTDYLFETIYNEEILETDLNKYSIEEEYKTNTIDNLIELITLLRKYREEKQISKSNILEYSIKDIKLSESQHTIVSKLANFIWKENEDFSIKSSFGEIFICQRKEDRESEILELKKLIANTMKEIEFNEKYINNPDFIAKAKPEMISQKQAKLEQHKKNLEFYKKQLEQKNK
ncbi:valine--tRNA ligase [Mycoplasma enhydrae]|uniref:valine--tRNA ligase n=1 Tax=Mycoplasma enhydrae TaxID=2499220 RepID=UPI00280B7208|nr:valine--tRNA ligase [Mycoplasma enhydrae]